MANIDLFPEIRRSIRHQQDLGTGFGERLAHAEIPPDILADRNADADTAEVNRARHLAGDENAFFVELAVIRQVDLVAGRRDLAAVQHGDGIVAALLVLARKTDHDARPAICRLGGKLLHRHSASLEEGRLQHQILRRIAGDEKLGQEQKIGPLGCCFRPRFAGLGEIAGDVADSRVELRDGNAKGIGSGLIFAHEYRLARGARLRNVGEPRLSAALQHKTGKIAGTNRRRPGSSSVHDAYVTAMRKFC